MGRARKKDGHATQLEYNYKNIKDKGTTSRRGQTHNNYKKLKGLSEIFDFNYKFINYFILFVMQRQVSKAKKNSNLILKQVYILL